MKNEYIAIEYKKNDKNKKKIKKRTVDMKNHGKRKIKK